MKLRHQFEHLVFDLDDTLLDTSRLLVPQAARESCEAMVRAGLDTTTELCLIERKSHVESRTKHGIFDHLVAVFGVREGAKTKDVSAAGYTAFHNRRVERDIQLFEGAAELLLKLREKYGLHLVTAGHRDTQEAKVRILGLTRLFDSIHYVDPLKGERKRDAFHAIMRATGAQPNHHLSVGNRLDSDISDARELGWCACWVAYGEYAHLRPANVDEIPEFEIKNIRELAEACRL